MNICQKAAGRIRLRSQSGGNYGQMWTLSIVDMGNYRSALFNLLLVK